MDPVSQKQSVISLGPGAAGQQIWLGSGGGVAVSAERDTTRLLRVLQGPIVQLAVSADGGLLMAGDDAGNGRICATGDGEPVDQLRCAATLGQGAIVGPHDYLTLDIRRAGTSWSPAPDGKLQARPVCADGRTPVPFDEFAMMPDRRRVVLRDALDWMIWDRDANAVTGRQSVINGMHLAYESGVAGLSRDGRFYFIYWDDCEIYDTLSAELVRQHPIRNRGVCAVLSGDGRRLVVGGEAGDVIVIGEDGAVAMQAAPGQGAILRVAMSVDQTRVAWLDERGAAGILDVGTGREVISPQEIRALLESAVV